MSNEASPVLIFIALFIIGGVVWLNSGGPERDSNSKPALNFRAPQLRAPVVSNTNGQSIQPDSEKKELTAEEIARQIEQVKKEVEEVQQVLDRLEAEEGISPYADIITLNTASARTSDPTREYVMITSYFKSSQEPINITGWHIKSLITGRSARIGQAAPLPYLGRKNTLGDIRITPGARVYVATGHSPIGSSIRLNACTGYFEQFQNWYPSIPRQCPEAEKPDYHPFPPSPFSDKCLDYLDRIPRCTMPVSMPVFLESSCSEYITEHFNYSACVDENKNNDNFYKKDWRVYLGRDEDLWKTKREVIELRDNQGKLVDSVSY